MCGPERKGGEREGERRGREREQWRIQDFVKGAKRVQNFYEPHLFNQNHAHFGSFRQRKYLSYQPIDRKSAKAY